MSEMDPARLRDDPSQPAGLRELLHQSTRDVGTGAEVARVAAKLAPIVGASALGAITASSAKASVFVGKAWLVSALVGGSVVVGGVVATQVAADRPAPVVAVSSTSQDIAAGSVAVGSTAEGVAPSEPVQARAPSEPFMEHSAVEYKAPQPRLKAKPQSTTVEEAAPPEAAVPPAVSEPAAAPQASESQLLGNAQSALGSNPARALALAEEHRQRFAGGALTQEREVIEIDALYRMGRKAEADRRAARFIATHQRSSYSRRVKELMTR